VIDFKNTRWKHEIESRKCPAFYKIQEFIAIFTKVRLFSPYSSRRIESKPKNIIPLTSISILSSHIWQVPPKPSFFLHAFQPEKISAFFFSPVLAFIQCAVSLKTDPQLVPEPVLHRLRSSASYLNFQFPLFSSRSPISCLPLLLCLLVLLSILQ